MAPANTRCKHDEARAKSFGVGFGRWFFLPEQVSTAGLAVLERDRQKSLKRLQWLNVEETAVAKTTIYS